MTNDSLITPEMKSIIGKPYGRMRSYPIAASDIRRWVLATYFPEPPPARYWDEEVASQSRWTGIVAPRDFNPFAWMAADPPGPQRGQPKSYDELIEGQFNIAGPGLKNMLNGGIDVVYGATMRPGDVVESVSTVKAYEIKTGKRGPLLFTYLLITWTNQDGAVVRDATRTTVRY